MSDPNRASPADYKAIFDDDRRGQAIFDQLYLKFATKVFVPGGLEGDRQTCYNAGARDVIEFITRQINRANGVMDPNQNEEN